MSAPRKLADLVRELLEAVAELGQQANDPREPEVYSSSRLPPRCSSRTTFARLCRAGRVSDAWKEGREWCCTRVAWEESRRRRPAAKRVLANDLGARGDDVAQATGMLRRAGLRVVAPGRRA